LFSQKERATWKAHDGGILSLTFAADGKALASGGKDRLIRVWDLETNTEQVVLKGHSGDINALANAPDGKMLASGTPAGALRLWAPPGRESRRINSPRGGLTALAFPDNKTILSADGRNLVILWGVDGARRLHEWPLGSPVHSLACSPNGYVAAGTEVGTIHIFRPDVVPAKSGE